MNRLVSRRRQPAALAALILGAATQCFAQTSPGSTDPRPQATSAGAAPPGESLVALAGVQGAYKGTAFQAQFDASTDEKTATAVIGWKDGAGIYALTLRGPLSSTTKEATPISLDGLSNGASVQLAVNHLFWRGPNAQEQAETDEICDRLFPTTKSQPCDYTKIPDGRDRTRYAELQHLADTPWFVGVSGGVSVTNYAFVDGADLKENSRTKADYSVAARTGIFRTDVGFLIGAIGYQRTSAQGADTVSLCRPLENTTATTCADAVLKPPTDTHAAFVSFQIRRKLAGDLAIAPQIQRDVANNITSILVPVYFLKDAKGSPIGGLRGGWRSDTKAVTISLFVGAAFGIAP